MKCKTVTWSFTPSQQVRLNQGKPQGVEVWISGIVERGSDTLVMYPVENRGKEKKPDFHNSETRRSWITNFQWKQILNSLGYQHFTVTHKNMFKQAYRKCRNRRVESSAYKQHRVYVEKRKTSLHSDARNHALTLKATWRKYCGLTKLGAISTRTSLNCCVRYIRCKPPSPTPPHPYPTPTILRVDHPGECRRSQSQRSRPSRWHHRWRWRWCWRWCSISFWRGM